jgi:DNA replication and repair protein RecF
LVIISPADRDLIVKAVKLEGSLWIASSLSWTSIPATSIQYQKVLNQRNALLKYFALNRVFENDTLAIYNEQLDGYGKHIFDKKGIHISIYTHL